MFLDGLSGQIEEYDEDYARRPIERITVDDDHFTVEFKSGLKQWSRHEGDAHGASGRNLGVPFCVFKE